MKKATLVLCAGLLLGMATKAEAQVKDISLTVSPVAGYTFWDRDLKLGNSAHWGVRAGFGLGSFLELRGVYEQSFDLKSNLDKSGWGFLNNLGDKLEDQSVNVRRLGGELKFNLLGNTAISPYLTAGAGVIRFKYDDPTITTGDKSFNEEQLYGALGAGVKFNLARRVALSLEARNLLFNTSKNNKLVVSNSRGSTLQNWGGIAALDIYLGGRVPKKDAVSRAYRSLYTDGFRGLKIVLEPGISYLDFSDKSLLHDQWMVGGAAGVDFNSFLGLRGFYYTSTSTPQTLNLNLDKYVRMYGGHLIGRLNFPQGVTPYLTLGAGYLHLADNYVDTQDTHMAKSGWFAMGGAGLEIPLHRTVALYGNVNAMLNQQDNPDPKEVLNPSEVMVNLVYQAGVRFNFGLSARNGESVYKAYAEELRMRERESNLDELNKLRAQYEDRINSLDQDLAQAIKYQDTLAITRVQLEQERAKAKIREVEASKEVVRQATVKETTAEVKPTSVVVAPVVAPQPAQPVVVKAQPAGTVALTATQLEELIARVVKQVKVATPATAQVAPAQISDFDKLLLLTAMQQGQVRPTNLPTPVVEQLLPQQQQVATATNDANDRLLQRIEEALVRLENAQKELTSQNQELQLKVERVQDQVENKSEQLHVVDLRNEKAPTVTTINTEYDQQSGKSNVYVKREEAKEGKQVINFRSLSLYTGPNFGDGTAWNVGVRANHQILDSNFDFTPEIYVGFGKKFDFGLSANVLYNVKLGESVPVSPYVGVGLGYFRTNGVNRFNTNVILGATLDKVLGGKLFVDYSVRGLFKNNQFAVGYRFNF